MTNRKPTATSRLKQDYLRLKRDPVPYITAEPLPTNILEWHYIVRGPEDSPYYGGFYYGTLLFPREFPFKPPSIFMKTPNGRFKTNTRLCLSISDFHPDTWNPAWSVSTILTGLLSFMLEQTPTLGSIFSTDKEKQQMARASLIYNLRNEQFQELFPDVAEEICGQLQTKGYNCDCNRQNSDKFCFYCTFLSNNKEKQLNNMISNGRPESINNEFTIQKDSKEVYGLLNVLVAEGNNDPISNQSTHMWYTILQNLIVVLSFLIFSLIVNLILKNLK